MKMLASGAAAVVLLLLLPALNEASLENPSLSEFYHLGLFYGATEQFDLAIANNTAMLAKHPMTREAEKGLVNIGHCYYNLMLRSMEELKKAKASGDVPKREIEEMTARVNSKMAQAVAAYQKVIAQFPALKAEAMIGIGLTYAAFGPEKEGAALGELKKVADSYPEEAGRAHLLIGDTYAKNGNAVAAEQAYNVASVLYPEVASLAVLKYADINLDSEEYGSAVDAYTTIIKSMGVDGAYNEKYHFIGSMVEKAAEKRGEAERALASKDDELNGYRSVYASHIGTNVGLAAQMKLTEALWYYGKSDDAAKTLKQIMDDYPKSLWCVKAAMLLAKLQGATQSAVESYQKIIRTCPSSIYRVHAQFKLAEVYLAQAKRAEDPGEQKKLRAEAKNACNGIIADYPLSVEGNRAKTFIGENNL